MLALSALPNARSEAEIFSLAADHLAADPAFLETRIPEKIPASR
jgi:hypothetical protein